MYQQDVAVHSTNCLWLAQAMPNPFVALKPWRTNLLHSAASQRPDKSPPGCKLYGIPGVDGPCRVCIDVQKWPDLIQTYPAAPLSSRAAISMLFQPTKPRWTHFLHIRYTRNTTHKKRGLVPNSNVYVLGALSRLMSQSRRHTLVATHFRKFENITNLLKHAAKPRE